MKEKFQTINKGYNQVFTPNKLSIGLVAPIAQYSHSPIPDMTGQLAPIQLAEKLGFSAVWLRDVPFNVPSFGDAGQIFDPFVYLGVLAASTSTIALGVSSIILPLRHPAHVAKAAASADVLSHGRLILGVASGDRPDEYPALNQSYADRAQRFRDSFAYIRQSGSDYPAISNSYGMTDGTIDLLPKPTAQKLPLLVTGSCQQSNDWIAKNSDGWMLYPRNNEQQRQVIESYRERTASHGRLAQPIMQPLYIDLVEKPDQAPTPIHLGMRLGSQHLCEYLQSLEQLGVNHVALNLRFNQLDIDDTLHRLSEEVLTTFNTAA
jgi:luciferase-type oxidoreductase